MKAIIKFIVRMIILSILLALAYKETGVWTAILLTCFAVNNELVSFLLSRKKDK